jgi:uncharacterized delta-60 repeat protein
MRVTTVGLATALVMGLVLGAPVRVLAVPGDLDTTFGVAGIATGPDAGLANAIAIQSDGKIVAAGGAGGRFALFRYTPDGTLDTTFGGDGIAIARGLERAQGVAVQADGKIVAVGNGEFGGFVLARYNTDGSLDATFSEDGKIATTFFSGGSETAWDLAIQADGRIVAAGGARGDFDCCSYRKFALARYNPDGTLDVTFGGDGKVTTNVSKATRRHPGFDAIYGLAVGSDGRIVAVGGAAGNLRFALARYNPDGTLDTTFSDDGKATTNFADDGLDVAEDVAVQADGKIVAAGFAGGGDGEFFLVRYTVDGTLDTTFSENGKVTTDLTLGFDAAYGIAIQSDGKIVAAGRADGFNQTFAVARYELDGSLDATFGVDGTTTTDISPFLDEALGVAIQADGKILAAGFASGNGVALVRYLAS